MYRHKYICIYVWFYDLYIYIYICYTCLVYTYVYTYMYNEIISVYVVNMVQELCGWYGGYGIDISLYVDRYDTYISIKYMSGYTKCVVDMVDMVDTVYI